MINVSTCCLRLLSPSLAISPLRFPSVEKGTVTTPTTKHFNSFAISATMGAAPVPVPPPMPAVIKTMSAPLRAFIILSLSSTAALDPTSGSPPAPIPLVTFPPIWTRLSTKDLFNACSSVFKMMNWTPFKFEFTIRVTAFIPPPPTPTTLMTTGLVFCSSTNSISSLRYKLFSIQRQIFLAIPFFSSEFTIHLV